ncbi:MAG: PLP-dependent aminotransferase family protein, partial [Bacteroidota bacterium]
AVNRRTISAALEELEAQGWVNIRPQQGCFVEESLPITKTRQWTSPTDKGRTTAHFHLPTRFDFLEYYQAPKLRPDHLIIDAGYPDVRLAPLQQLSRHLNGITRSRRLAKLFNYSNNFTGDPQLRQTVCDYLRSTRGIPLKDDNIIITRGSLMGFSLIFQALLRTGERVIVGDPGFKVANNIIRIAGGQLQEVPVDKDGIDVAYIAKICAQQGPPRAVFIMPHHHNPTTVSLSAQRRMHLLQLAEQYSFAIVEDDYDYDYHYASSPILPLASSDRHGSVIYVGSLSKTVAPGLRIGFIAAPSDFIQELSRLSRFLDCHGNMALERSVAMLYEDGEIRRHLKKSLKVYHRRRDHFCTILRQKLGAYVRFKNPEGGLAAWVSFDPSQVDIIQTRKRALEKGLQIPKCVFKDVNGQSLNAIRMGFASLTEAEMTEAIDRLSDVIRSNQA